MYGCKNNLILIFVILYNTIIEIKSCELEQLINITTYNYIKANAKWEPMDYDDNIFKNLNILQATHYYLGLIRLSTFTNSNTNTNTNTNSNTNTKLSDMNTIVEVKEIEKNIDINMYTTYNFDGRVKFKRCLKHISNQHNCGGSWAFALTDVFSNRVCIRKPKEYKSTLSVQSLLACNKLNYGCNGGRVEAALYHLVQSGITTEICQRINVHKFSDNENHNIDCKANCDFDFITKHMFYIDRKAIKLIDSFQEARESLFNDGPLYAEMRVFEDFFHYNGGVYNNIVGMFIGYHAVRVILLYLILNIVAKLIYYR